MHFKLAILTALARRPDGRATLDELRHEVELLTANEDHVTREPLLGDIDIFQSGLVVSEGDELKITDEGRSTLDALETFSKPSVPNVSPPSSMARRLTDGSSAVAEAVADDQLETEVSRDA